jgi:hypothetical protein
MYIYDAGELDSRQQATSRQAAKQYAKLIQTNK